MFTYIGVNLRALVLASGGVFVSVLGTSIQHYRFNMFDPNCS